ncbi:protein jagged-1-like isoform X2 [Haliotis rufescens]|uniref:protein jagged-1-like isoform X2 n=1 Tax=Haliotis rufescens TaxID=6454 RepID=UPI001EB080E4|nr:protein jagged-1-like isoform X2 [Haliotis rufescens]
MKVFVLNAVLLITVLVLVERTSGLCSSLGKECRNGKFRRDPDNCNQFCQCAHGGWYQKRCPRGLFFDEVHNVCNWPDQSPMCDPPEGLCDPNPCQNGGTCVSNRMGYSCLCRDAYGGNDCALNTTCPRYACPNNVTTFNYPDWQDATCKSFFSCELGSLRSRQCPGNRLFSFMLLQCVQPAQLEYPCTLNLVDSQLA